MDQHASVFDFGALQWLRDEMQLTVSGGLVCRTSILFLGLPVLESWHG